MTTFNRETVAAAVAVNTSCTAAVAALGLSVNGYWCTKLKDFCDREKIDHSHWTGRSWRKGLGKLG